MQPDDTNEGDPAAAALAQLGADPRSVSVAAQIRRLLPDIEAALERGAKQADVVAALGAQGVRVTLGQLRTELWRARRKRKAKPGPTKAAAPAQGAPPASTAPAGRPPPPGRGASKAERDAYAASVISAAPSNPLLAKRLKKEKGEE